MQSAQTLDDYQSAIDLINNDFINLHAMEADYNDKTPWDHPHATDASLMQHYGVSGPGSGQVLVVSLIEQTVRFYNNGKLIRSFLVVTGQYLKPIAAGILEHLPARASDRVQVVRTARVGLLVPTHADSVRDGVPRRRLLLPR